MAPIAQRQHEQDPEVPLGIGDDGGAEAERDADHRDPPVGVPPQGEGAQREDGAVHQAGVGVGEPPGGDQHGTWLDGQQHAEPVQRGLERGLPPGGAARLVHPSRPRQISPKTMASSDQ